MRRSWLGVAVAAAVVTSVASPAESSPPGSHAAKVAEPPAAAFTSSRQVHLITGDTVRMMTRADGVVVPTIVSGPHAAAPVARWSTESAAYLMPRIPASERRRLDPSLFDVRGLAALHGRVPIVVTLNAHATKSQLRSLGDELGIRRAALRAGGTTRAVRTSYSSTFRGLTASALAGVRSIRLAGAPSKQERAAAPTHTLTVQVSTPNGGPAQGVVVFIENVDDVSTFLETPVTNRHGMVSVDVPEGDYSVLAFSFRKLVIEPEVAVTADTPVSLNLGAATVHPQVTMPGYRKVEAVLGVGRAPENGFTFPLEFSGPHFFMKVQPTSGLVTHGSLQSGVSTTLTRIGDGPARTSDHLAITADLADGVPDSLTYTHHRGDFARLVQRVYANGPAGLRQSFFAASSDIVWFFTGQDYDVRVPGRRVVLVQASPHVYYQQTVMPQATPTSTNLTQLISVRRYVEPGKTYVVPFARGPVGPGIERPKFYTTVMRRAGHLSGYLPLFSGAASGMDSWIAARDGSWSLHQGRHLLAHGTHQIFYNVPVRPGRRTYVLRASSHPTADNWTLSTNVSDVWTFHSRHGRRHPLVLMPVYVPPSGAGGFIAPGRTSFRLAFTSLQGDQPTVADAVVEVSTDRGGHWTNARVVRTGTGAFRVHYVTPAAVGSQRTVSIRVTGTDGHGTTVQETALDAYRVR